MKDDVKQLIEKISPIIDSITGLRDYLETCNSFTDIALLFSKFIDNNKHQLNQEDIFAIKIIEEEFCKVAERINKLGYVNKHLQIDDTEILKEFYSDYKSSSTGKIRFVKAEIQHYKTITEKLACKEIDFEKYLDKYTDCTHPYVCTKIAQAYLSAKKYDIGLVFLQKALMPIFTCQNIYWHNHLAMYGCTEAFHEIQHLAGVKGLFSLMYSINSNFAEYFEVLYLYITRSIEMSKPHTYDSENIKKTDIECINFLSIRADIEYHYQSILASLRFGVNPQVQFLSDKYMSYYISEQFGLGQIAENAMKDAYKMYQNGSLHVNDTGGLREIEEATFSELVARGQMRAIDMAKEYYEKLPTRKWLNQQTLTELMGGLRNIILEK